MPKAPEKFCPVCGGDITDTHELAPDPSDASIKVHEWWCDDCEYLVQQEVDT